MLFRNITSLPGEGLLSLPCCLFTNKTSFPLSNYVYVFFLQGEVQLQVCYDKQAHILYVIVKRARNLRTYQGIPPDPLIKVYLLPGRV
jgi:hypothetical protein